MTTRTIVAFLFLSAMASQAQAEPRAASESTIRTSEAIGLSKRPRLSGISTEVLTGIMLFDSSRSGLDPRFLAGARLAWQMPQTVPEETWRRIFFIDLTYMWSATSDGTYGASVTSNQHLLTAAPAIAYPFRALPLQLYAQVGAGLAITAQSIRARLSEANIGSTSFLFQYGAGVRAQPQIGPLAASFRFEVTRFVRGSMHDTFIGLTAGLVF